MPKYKFDGHLDVPTEKSIQGKIEEITRLVPILTNLNREERGSVLKIGNRGLGFIQDVDRIVKNHPGFFPSYGDKEDFQKQVVTYYVLRNLEAEIAVLHEAVEDTMFAMGDTVTRGALNVYQNVKQANKNKVPGATEHYERLLKRFPNGSTGSIQDLAETKEEVGEDVAEEVVEEKS